MTAYKTLALVAIVVAADATRAADAASDVNTSRITMANVSGRTLRSRAVQAGAGSLRGSGRNTAGERLGKAAAGGGGPVPLRELDPKRLRLLSLNTWHEGTEVEGGFGMIVEVLAMTDADFVVLSEVRNKDGMLTQRLQEALNTKGLTYHGAHVQADVALLSRWPIEQVQVVSQKIVAYHLAAPRPLVVCTAHLDYTHYAVMLPRGYDSDKYFNRTLVALPRPVTDVAQLHAVDEASRRGPELQEFLEFARSVDAPVVLAGDFNEASHLDWTAATKDLFDHNGVEIEWRHSKLLSDAGFRDTWRELHPDPVTQPGHTWPSEARGVGNTGWGPRSDERDRIDFVYHNGRGVGSSAAWLVGSPRYYVRGSPVAPSSHCPFFSPSQELPWPSDHKGLLVELEVAGPAATRNWPDPLGNLPGLNMSSRQQKHQQQQQQVHQHLKQD